MPAPGYYKTNYRALRFREMLRMYGWRRAPWLYLASRSMRPSGIAWMPSLWSETACPRENLSNEFWLHTTRQREQFEQLGFIEIGFLKISNNLNPLFRDTGGIRYWNPDRTCFGLLLCNRVYQPKKRAETVHSTIVFTAVFDDGTSFACTDNKGAFDPLSETEVLRLKSDDPAFIHAQFQERLKHIHKTPRKFPDLESLRQWYDERQQRYFEARVKRRLFLPMTEAEIALARARFAGKAPPPIPPPKVKFSWTISLVIIACVILLELLKHYLRPHR